MKKSSIQTFIEKFIQTLLSLLKIILMSSYGIERFKAKNSQEKCVILGNGPSLSETLEQNLGLIQKTDSFGVNFFWKTDYYTQVKPKYYIIVSTNYWTKGKIDANEEGRQQTFNGLATKTNWEMTLVVPAMAKKHQQWKEVIALNKNITIKYINITPIEGFDSFVNWALKQNLGLPRPHNVLIPAIKIASDYRYNEVYIVGADHSWLKEIFVGSDNKVYLTQKHFYDNKPAPDVMYDGTSNRVRTLADMLMKFVYSFRSYFVLREYAKKQNVRVFNATPNSYIDAFERKKL